jgi:hypothetical protein
MTLSPAFAFRTTLAVALLSAATLVSAQSAGAASAADRFEQRFDKRQDKQEDRIENGMASGALTPHESRRLASQQAGLVRAEARAEADGKLTRREAVQLEQRQDHASHSIARQKHDAQTRK